MGNTGFVTVGRVSRAHGLKGEFCIDCYADSPLLLAEVSRIYLKLEGRYPQKLDLSSCREHSKGLLLRVEGVTSREAVKPWLGAEVWVRRRDLPQAALEGLFQRDVRGYRVYMHNGQTLGRIQDSELGTGQELWVIVTDSGREVLLPAVDEFVHEIDEDREWVRVDPPPGLLTIYGLDEEDLGPL